MKPPFFIGLDLGQQSDYTALTVVQELPEQGEYHLRHLERFDLGTPYKAVAKRTRRVQLRLQGDSYVVADATSESPSHTYAEAGIYTVSLIASRGEESDTEEKVDFITVEEPPMPPEAAFSVSETTVELTVTNEDGSDTAFETVVVEPRRTFRVEYRADASFTECTVTYYNEDDGRTQTEITFEDGPWTLAFDATAREFDTFLAGFSLSCFEFEANETASAELVIDGEVFDSGEQTGSSVSIDLDARLTLDGAEEF